MISNLSQQDKNILKTNKTIDLTSSEYAYLGGSFGSNDNDYIEVLLYDTNNNFVESSVVDRGDYIIEKESISIQTGTVLRKMGYDRGRYLVKYKFLRKQAGSYETILTNEDGELYNGEFNVDDLGNILDPDGNKLFLKENKYIVHEISPTRQEIRIIAQNINNAEYNDNLMSLSKSSIKKKIDGTFSFHDSRGGIDEDTLNEVKQIKSSVELPKTYEGSLLYLNNTFISEIIPPEPIFADSNPTEEVLSSDVKARWIISDISAATLAKGNIDYINKMWSVFNTLSDDEKITLRSIEQRGMTSSNNFLFQKYKNIIDGPRPFFNFGSVIKLKSVSSKPNVSTKYTWKISGRDYMGDKNRNFQNQIFGSTNDVVIAGSNNPTFFQEESSTGSEIEIKLVTGECHVSVQLDIECKISDNQIVKDFVYIPYCIRTPE